MLQRIILASLFRRVVGYLGVGGLVGLDSDMSQLGGAVMAAGTLAWSLYEKVREYRKTRPVIVPQLFVGLLVATGVFAAPDARADEEKRFTWEPPTLNVDGTSLADVAIVGYRMRCGAIVLEVPKAQPFRHTFAAGGPYTCTLQTLTADAVSDPSNAVVFTVAPTIPNAPGAFSAE